MTYVYVLIKICRLRTCECRQSQPNESRKGLDKFKSNEKKKEEEIKENRPE